MPPNRIENRCAQQLIDNNMFIATAESCTGGMISAKLTSIPGSSSYFERGFVTYSNEAKCEMLGVSEKTIAIHGAVSRETAREMAKGALKHSRAHISVAVTGIAGPTGGTKEKPVGTVFIAVAVDDVVECKKFIFPGERDHIREQTCDEALKLVCAMMIS